MKILLALAAASLILAPVTHADDYDRLANALCTDLYASPSLSEVDFELQALVASGLTYTQAAKFMVAAVAQYCPDNLVLLKHYADSGSKGSVA